MFEKELKLLIKGIEINSTRIFSDKELPGRIDGERRFELFLEQDGQREFLMFLKIFEGKRRYYRPFVEIYGINSDLSEFPFSYFGSDVESLLMRLFSRVLSSGGKMFVTYEGDVETAWGLNIGLPPPVTRSGFILFNSGFTWFKDWYFPEGGNEGSQKLQGEKPLDQIARKKHLNGIKFDLEKFLKDHDAPSLKGNELFLTRAINRAEVIFDKLDMK